MNLLEDSDPQKVLDEALKLLYKSRPAKAAALLGLVKEPTDPIILAPNITLPDISLQKESALSFRSQPLPNPASLVTMGASKHSPLDAGNPYRVGPESLDIQAGAYSQGDNKSSFKVDQSTGPDNLTGVSASGELGGIAKGPGMGKQAMTDEEYLYYQQAGMLPGEAGSGLALSPTQMLGVGGTGLGVAGANRLRAKNMAARELKNIRREYLKAVEEGTLDSKLLANLNKELKLRGAGSKLRRAGSKGIADATMSLAEQDLTSKILKKRYRGALPTIAAGLLGTLAYNKLNKD